MKAAYDCGVNFFDCAESYAGGESEIVMGEAVKKYGWKRNDLVISTKVSCSRFLNETCLEYANLVPQRYTGALPLATTQ